MYKLTNYINNLHKTLTSDSALGNPFNISLTITLLVMMIIYIVIVNEVEIIYDDQTWTLMSIKMMFFCFISVLCIVFISFTSIEQNAKRKYLKVGDREILSYVNGPIKDAVPYTYS